jgi:hypothetical protein
LASLIQSIALANHDELVGKDVWALREELGSISSEVFGPASFNPIIMPKYEY